MKIAYGIHGYGRGHAMRALSVLPQLAQRHELLILAGSEAYDVLSPEHDVIRIPTLRYHHMQGGRLSPTQSILRNFPGVLDTWFHGPTVRMVEEAYHTFKPDLVISDSELFTHRAAKCMSIPRITFDHFAVLVYGRLGLSGMDRLACWAQSHVYKLLFGEPDRVVASAFFDAPARRPGVRVVGPAIRQEVRETQPSRDDYLLVYLTQGKHAFSSKVEKALLKLDMPIRIYGTPRRGLHGNLQFKPIANLPFIEDLAGCRAVFASCGNQLIGEAIYFKKPILGMPIDCLEQRINAEQIVRMGIGMRTSQSKLTSQVLRDFLSRESEFAAKIPAARRDGALEAIEAIEAFGAELVNENTNAVRDNSDEINACRKSGTGKA